MSALAATMLLLGCNGKAMMLRPHDVDGGELDVWVDRELAPYLVDQLGRQPRFKGEPVLLVSMDGADVRPDIDTLTGNLRARLMDRLLRTPGTDLVWRPSVQPWEHHRGDDMPKCGTASSARYFVGIDIAPASGREYRVSVRALDVGAGTWVTGFGKSWRGSLTRAQQRELAERHPDAYLRGLRVLPFLSDEADLLAAYLARNLSCLLRERGGTGYGVFVDTRVGGDPKLAKFLTLVSHNLARHRSVRIKDKKKDAELVISGSLSEIDGSLHQVWIKARPNATNVHLAGIDTSAYIHLHRAGAKQASVAGLPLRQPARREGGVVMSPLRVLRSPRCGSARLERLAGPPAVERGDCFWIEFDLFRPAHVLALNHAVDGRLTQLSSVGCTRTGGGDRPLLPQRDVRLSPRSGRGFGWAGSPGVESLYAIAVTDAGIARQIARHLGELPDGCLAGEARGIPAEDGRRWLAQLDRLLDRAGDGIDWQAVRIRHAAP